MGTIGDLEGGIIHTSLLLFILVDADGDCKVMPPVHLGGVSFHCGLVSIPINFLLLMNTSKGKVCL